MPKQEASKGKKEVFAWYLLQSKRFHGVMKSNEKSTSKCHEQSLKMERLGTPGVDFWNFGRFCEISNFMFFLCFSIDPKNQQQSATNPKVKRKRCQGRFTSPLTLPWKTPLSDACDNFTCMSALWCCCSARLLCCFINVFSFDDLVFHCIRKRKKFGKRYPKLIKI